MSAARKFTECREAPGCYRVARVVSADDIITQARKILAGRCAPGSCLASTRDAREYLMHELAGLDREVFGAIFLDQRHCVLAIETIFRGTIAKVDVYPREVARRALAHNAAALVAFHNHPSGSCRPSRMDEIVTERLKAALSWIDVRLLDHLVIAAGDTASLADLGIACLNDALRATRSRARRRAP
jgi:DNA repair protein RadC